MVEAFQWGDQSCVYVSVFPLGEKTLLQYHMLSLMNFVISHLFVAVSIKSYFAAVCK